ncbi:MAG TPA: glycosyltransferase family 2 protein [Dehalococcoidia bacterium]|nr:glycosyltransferase family 2 protein [Dehalococcoidia bacterium]
MSKLSSISAVFPCYNDGASIPDVISRIETALPELTDDYEIIVVNDGSTDSSGAVLAELSRERPHLQVITLPHNQGYGAAIRTGLTAATRDYVFYTDGDGQYDPSELQLLVERIGPGIDVVNGYKISRSDSVYRKIVGNTYKAFVRTVFRLRLRDIDCDFRLLRREVLRGIRLQKDSGAFCVELVKKLQSAGAQFREVPVHHYPRQHGSSQFMRPGRVFATFVELAILWWQLRRAPETRPHAVEEEALSGVQGRNGET